MLPDWIGRTWTYQWQPQQPYSWDYSIAASIFLDINWLKYLPYLESYQPWLVIELDHVAYIQTVVQNMRKSMQCLSNQAPELNSNCLEFLKNLEANKTVITYCITAPTINRFFIRNLTFIYKRKYKSGEDETSERIKLQKGSKTGVKTS